MEQDLDPVHAGVDATPVSRLAKEVVGLARLQDRGAVGPVGAVQDEAAGADEQRQQRDYAVGPLLAQVGDRAVGGLHAPQETLERLALVQHVKQQPPGGQVLSTGAAPASRSRPAAARTATHCSSAPGGQVRLASNSIWAAVAKRCA